jgi:hypothetical protein
MTLFIKDNYEDIDGYVRELLCSTLWNIGYHERELVKHSRQLKLAKKTIEAAGYDFQAMADNATDADIYEGDFKDVEELCHAWVQDRVGSVERHEEQLQQAHKQLAMMKIFMVRGNFEIEIADVQREVQARLDENP